MQKYFISDDDFKKCQITGDDVHHIKDVMRFKSGDKIKVSSSGSEALCSIVSIERDIVMFKIEMAVQNNNELPFLVDLYQGYPKGDKLDDICKHVTELGASNIYGVITKRSVFKLDPKKKESKILRFNKICKEASEQSDRRMLSKFVDIIDLKKIDFSLYDHKILCYEEVAKNGEASNFKNIVKNIKPNEKIAIIVGPEGGIDENEASYLKSIGFIPSALGPRILRTETAGLYALSAISYEWELK